MNQQKKAVIFWYALADYLMAMIAWAGFFLFRKKIEKVPVTWDILSDANFWYGILLIPICWLLFYSLFDKYNDLYRMSRFSTLARTFLLSFIGVVLLFFTLILDDFVNGYQTYYASFFFLFISHFLLTTISRTILLTQAKRRVQSGKVRYRTLLIGGNQKAKDLYEELTAKKQGLGNDFVGYIDINGGTTNELGADIPCLGKIKNIEQVIKEQQIEEVIIAIETSEHNRIKDILNTLFNLEQEVLIKIIPDMYDIMLGSVKMNHVFGAALIATARTTIFY